MKIHKPMTAIIGCLAATAGVAACGDDGTTTTVSAQTAQSASADVTADGGLPQGGETVNLDPADFTAEIDNPYMPFTVGSRWVYSESDGTGPAAKVVVTVTDKTKTMANGIEARVVTDVLSENGTPTEITNDWYAQDSAGNVWYMGEDTAEYVNGKVDTRAGSFQAGVDGAQPGIAMPADPEVGLSYRQEYYKGEAEDNGAIVSHGEQANVPAGHYTDLLMTRDLTPLEPRTEELKFFARDIGQVLALHTSPTAEREELISYTPGK